MRPANFKLLTILAVASFSAAGCGDDDPATDTTDTTDTAGDTDTTDATDTNTNPDTDATTGDTDVTDTDTGGCGTRECGTFAGRNCGTCDSKPGTVCSAAGRCEVPGGPLGAFCGITATCTPASANFPACLDAQCASGACLSHASGGRFVFAIFRDWTNVFNNSVCTQSCLIYRDANNDGVNDADQEDDCNPADIANGPAGDTFRCVNFAQPTANPVGLCVPGTTFAGCDSNADCPSGEACELTSILGELTGHCVANYKAGTWGGAVGIGGACNDDPANGDVNFCKSGYCEFFGCATACAADADCDTTTGAGVCNNGTCTGKPGTTCTTDLDCSAFECGALQLTETESFGRCGPKNCEDELGCGPGFTCQWGWNGSVNEAGPENRCTAEQANGVGLGQACDPDPTDNQVVNGGAVCKSDLCLGEKCSQVCSKDSQCGANGLCTMYEYTEAFIGCNVDADCGAGNACTGTDGACYNATTQQYISAEEDTFALALLFCTDFTGSTGSCLSQSDCAANEACDLYIAPNWKSEGVLDPDGPYNLAGKCKAVTGFAAGKGELGASCTSFSDCRSGFCFPVNDTTSFCTQPCTASSQCGQFDLLGEEPVTGYCDTFLYGYGGDLQDFTTNNYVGLCLFDFGSTSDCSDDFACDGAEACFPNIISNNPSSPAKVEHLCLQVWEDVATRGTKTVGQACNPEAEIEECATGICVTEVGSTTLGYCSKPCASDNNCGNGTTCTERVRYPRKGAYEANTGSFGLCLKDQECQTCTSHYDCPGDLICGNLGTAAAPSFACIPGCETAADCTEETAKTCNGTTDSFGVTASGCFSKSAGGTPVNYCAP
jgi:hypothetical protein